MQIVRARVLLLTFAALVAGHAHAQAVPGSVEAGIGWGRLFSGVMPRGSNAYFDRDVKVDDSVLKGFWLGAQLTPRWAAEIAVRRTPTHLTEAHRGVFPTNNIIGGLDYSSIEGLAFRTWTFGNLVPYAGGGVGITNLDIDEPDPAVQDSNQFCVSFAAGAKFHVARWAGLRFDVRQRMTSIDGGHWLKEPEILAGFFLAFRPRR